MKCKRCGWPTSLWERDIWSGLCEECRQVDRHFPGLEGPAALQQALSTHAARCLEHGESPDGLERKLLAAGLQPQEAASLAREVIARLAPYTRARELLEHGAGVLDVRRKMVENGLAPEEAAMVVEAVQKKRSGASKGESVYADEVEGPRPGLAIVGIVVIGAGVVLAIGNMSGVFPTIPFAGFLTMTVGSMIFGAGWRGSKLP
jgi:hypothetical protein